MWTQCKAHAHAVVAKGGIWVPITDPYGVEGPLLPDRVNLAAPCKERIGSLRRFVEAFDAEIDLFTRLAQYRLARERGYTAIEQIPGIGPVREQCFVAEIGDVHRFAGPTQLTCWAGLTPSHHESDTKVQRGRITKQGSRLVRWAAIESVKMLPATTYIGGIRDKAVQRRGHRNIGAVAAARKQLAGARLLGRAITTSVRCTGRPVRHEHPNSVGRGSCRS
ncbi:transposase [Antrihabitans sp. YC2-6]|uniref:transposase n=1 Tax=Antrihabitans sp. YC2-6 TaxID=2799498 RepID=UPI0018F36D5A|nr:transposase [Antrihabitans sp. YC2-6]MBJ8348240.1 IS110 family transposase [Antrihabitans sp. YC2-6]